MDGGRRIISRNVVAGSQGRIRHPRTQWGRAHRQILIPRSWSDLRCRGHRRASSRSGLAYLFDPTASYPSTRSRQHFAALAFFEPNLAYIPARTASHDTDKNWPLRRLRRHQRAPPKRDDAGQLFSPPIGYIFAQAYHVRKCAYPVHQSIPGVQRKREPRSRQCRSDMPRDQTLPLHACQSMSI